MKLTSREVYEAMKAGAKKVSMEVQVEEFEELYGDDRAMLDHITNELNTRLAELEKLKKENKQ